MLKIVVHYVLFVEQGRNKSGENDLTQETGPFSGVFNTASTTDIFIALGIPATLSHRNIEKINFSQTN
jgi:hypothetical protein